MPNPIQFPDIQRVSFDEANPWMTAISRGLTMGGQYSGLLDAALARQKAQAELPYVGKQAEANLGYTQAQIPYLQSQAMLTKEQARLYDPETKAKIALQRAQERNFGAETEKTIAESKFIPTKYDIEMRNSYARQNQIINSASNNFRQWAQTPEGQRVISEDPEMAKKVYEDMIRSSSMATGLPSSNDQSMNLSGESNQKISTEEPILHKNKEEIIKNIQQAASDKSFKSIYPSDIQKRIYAGDRFKVTAPVVIENFDKASEYFSPQGQFKLKQDEAKALKGYVSPELQAYRNFKKGIEQLSVQGAFLEGVPADQISRGQYHKIYDIEKFLNNPEGARESLNTAINYALLADEANKKNPGSLLKNSEQDEKLKKALSNVKKEKKQNNRSNEIDYSSMSDEELKKIAAGG